MPLYLSVPLPGPFRYTKRIGRRRGPRGPFWSQPWFWLSGAFVLYAAAVMVWFELLLVYLLFLYLFMAGRWAVQWIVTIAIAGPKGAVQSRRDDKIHKARAAAQGEDW